MQDDPLEAEGVADNEVLAEALARRLMDVSHPGGSLARGAGRDLLVRRTKVH